MKKKKIYELLEIIQELEHTYKNDRVARGDKMKILFEDAKKILTTERDKMKPL